MKFLKIKYPIRVYVKNEYWEVTEKVMDYIRGELKRLGLEERIDFVVGHAGFVDSWYNIDVLIDENKVNEKTIKEVLYIVWKAEKMWKDLAYEKK